MTKNAEHVARHLAKKRLRAIEYKGGRCARCGYAHNLAALQFHHLDRATKSFAVSGPAFCKQWAVLQAELDKCILLCANCHAEVEYPHLTAS